MEPVHLLYVACGRADISVQALYAAYSALAYQGSLNLSIHIYTDDLASFHPLAGHIAVDLNSDMWNSGAIGLHASQFHLLETILAFIDTVSPHYKKQLVEQYAVSYYLQKNAHVHPCDDRLFHYWNQKAEYGKAISQRLERWRSFPLEAALQELRQNRIELPPYQPQHGWFRRLSDRILGEGRESGGV